ncbi:hypothetical protein [Novosphingobium huizhouense]|uniref:hypothetical protein n=1 Tax=Novosphingobium huizhouense TaxID=2866625 RepID=UPI001CD8A920|nr:hypothetical protein [Novosphingobium huizhouense]
MSHDPTIEEIQLYDGITNLASVLWTASASVEGLSTSPKMFSVMLFKRLWSNHQGFTVLWKEGRQLEADIILRSAVEAAICIAANFNLKDDFVTLMRQDAIYTALGQIKMHRDDGDFDFVRMAEKGLREMRSKLPAEKKAAKLDWKELANAGGVPQLYGFHRHLSGFSSHVTGFSILRDVDNAALRPLQEETKSLARRTHLMMMAAATLHGTMIHSGMIDQLEICRLSSALTLRLNDVTAKGLDSPPLQ